MPTRWSHFGTCAGLIAWCGCGQDVFVVATKNAPVTTDETSAEVPPVEQVDAATDISQDAASEPALASRFSTPQRIAELSDPDADEGEPSQLSS